MAGLLERRVAVVTGAGRGLGRAHAKALAEQGAKVVVNDLGVNVHGLGVSRAPADDVVEEIVSTGGIAIANYDDVALPRGAQNIMGTAIENFGQVDILVNNAGIQTHNEVFNITDEEWDLMMKVHLYGTFYCTRAVCQTMMKQRYGRIINTSSISGMGQIEQAHYAAAKEGIVGFTRSVAKELSNFGITCNAIRPRAGTRMSLGEFYQSMVRRVGKEEAEQFRKAQEARKPEDTSSLVVYLASEEAANINGCVFHVARNCIALFDDPPRLWKIIKKKQGRWQPEELVELMPKSLAVGLARQHATAVTSLKVSPNASFWEWDNGTIIEKPPPLMWEDS